MPQEYRHSHPSGKPALNTQGYLLYILPAPLIVKLIVLLLSISGANLIKLALTIAALFFFYSGAHMTRTTLLRFKNIPPNRPNKIKDQRLLAAIYTTIGVFILMLIIRRPILIDLVMVACAFVGYYLLYGLPSQQKNTELDFETIPKATREAIKGAYADLETIESLGKQLNPTRDKDLSNILGKVLDQSYVIMDLLVKTPEDAGRARRFLNVYINRIKEILIQYIKLSRHEKAEHLRPRLVTTLREVEHAFREKRSKLLDDDIFRLDIQLEVLDEQIKHED